MIVAVIGGRTRPASGKTWLAYANGQPAIVLSLTPIDAHPNKAAILANVDDHAHVVATARSLRRLFHDEAPDLRAAVSEMYLGPADSSRIDIQVKGPDAAHIAAVARQVVAVPGVIDVKDDWENRTLQLRVEVDQVGAATSTDCTRSRSSRPRAASRLPSPRSPTLPWSTPTPSCSATTSTSRPT